MIMTDVATMIMTLTKTLKTHLVDDDYDDFGVDNVNDNNDDGFDVSEDDENDEIISERKCRSR